MISPRSTLRHLLSALGRPLASLPAAMAGAVLVLSSLLVWTGPAASAQTSTTSTTVPHIEPVSANPQDIGAGRVLYEEHCASCHGEGGVGTGRAPQIYDVGSAAIDFYLSTGRMPLNYQGDEALRHTPYFNQAQISQITAYINSLGVASGSPGPGIPTVEPLCSGSQTNNCVTLAQGQQLFLMNCAQCHDASGAGGMLSKGYVVPSLYQADATQVAEAIRIGPRPMPNFGPGQLSDQQVSAISDYVQYLRHPVNAGGMGIAHFGPVPEGFVGIVIGLGILLVAARLIGTRA
jgi:ubiquinol-cytochrome c reductase cytochrome c subunit